MTSASPRPNETRSIIRPCDLPMRVQEGLKYGYRHVGYDSERTLLFAVVLGAAHRGFGLVDISLSFRTGSLCCPAVTRWQVAAGDLRVERELARLYDQAVAKINVAGDRQASTAAACALRDAVEVLPLPGRGGPSERAVLVAIADVGVAQATTSPRVSRLQLEVATGKSNSVIEGALDRLIRRGVLKQLDRGRFDRRSQWQITASAVMASSRGALTHPSGGVQTHPGLVPSPADDLWFTLGLVAWEVLRLLAVAGPVSARDAARVLGRNPVTVRRHLNRLRDQHQLVERDSDGVWTALVDHRALQAAAERCGAAGAGLRHEERVRAKNEAGRQWLDQRDEAVAKETAYKQVRRDFEASSVVGGTGTGGVRFVVLDHRVMTRAAWRAAGSPADFRQMPGTVPTAGAEAGVDAPMLSAG